MINTDPIYQEWTIQRDRQQWAQDIEQRQKKTTKTLNTEKLKDEQHRPYLSRMDNSERQTTLVIRNRTKTHKTEN